MPSMQFHRAQRHEDSLAVDDGRFTIALLRLLSVQKLSSQYFICMIYLYVMAYGMAGSDMLVLCETV